MSELRKLIKEVQSDPFGSLYPLAKKQDPDADFYFKKLGMLTDVAVDISAAQRKIDKIIVHEKTFAKHNRFDTEHAALDAALAYIEKRKKS